MKRFRKQHALTVCALGLGLGLAACSEGSRTPGITVLIQAAAVPQLAAYQIAGSKTITNTEGTQVVLERAYLTVSSVDLSRDCEQPGYSWIPTWQTPWDWIIPTAEAHGDAQPTTINEASVIDLLAADGAAMELGVLSPPAAIYCGLDAQILAASSETRNLPEDLDMLGMSIALDGYFGEDQTPFSVRSSRAFSPVLKRFPALENLESADDALRISLLLHYDRWFDGLDLSALAQQDGNAVTQLLQMISTSTSVQLTPQVVEQN